MIRDFDELQEKARMQVINSHKKITVRLYNKSRNIAYNTKVYRLALEGSISKIAAYVGVKLGKKIVESVPVVGTIIGIAVGLGAKALVNYVENKRLDNKLNESLKKYTKGERLLQDVSELCNSNSQKMPQILEYLERNLIKFSRAIEECNKANEKVANLPIYLNEYNEALFECAEKYNEVMHYVNKVSAALMYIEEFVGPFNEMLTQHTRNIQQIPDDLKIKFNQHIKAYDELDNQIKRIELENQIKAMQQNSFGPF
ncbi:hypothetical protein [Spirosoma fluviale]|uniref:Uncharacterized protein n=1 Tax=Spirosoma fluviale TaxID=1597977 RepID=A0A286G3A4_9BACT|nr:hypothetical protein [Spirosoma fluviale]SOD90030.1 hypothetical protein SAMN06269250_3274 [Spirosoma fluviale]